MQIQQSLNPNDTVAFLSDQLFNTFPTTRSHNDKALLLAQLFARIFDQFGLAVKDNQIL